MGAPPSREYINDRRARARAAGMCGVCCVRKPTDGRKTCDVCLASVRATESRAAARARGDQVEIQRGGPTSTAWCIECQSANRHRRDCPTINHGKEARA